MIALVFSVVFVMLCENVLLHTVMCVSPLGAVLSCAQLIADSIDRNDFDGISGNLVKLLLGVVSGV